MTIIKKLMHFIKRPRKLEDLVPYSRAERDEILAIWPTAGAMEAEIESQRQRAAVLYEYVQEHLDAIGQATTDGAREAAIDAYQQKINSLTSALDNAAGLSVHLSLLRMNYR